MGPRRRAWHPGAVPPGRTSAPGVFLAWLARRRFPTIFAVAAGLFVLDLLIPDGLPFADELLLGVLTLLFGAWRRRGAEGGQPSGDPGDQI